MKRRPGSTIPRIDRSATEPIRTSSNSACSCRARSGSRAAARRDKMAPHRSDARERPGSISGAGTRSTRNARSSVVARRVSSTRRNQQSASSATRSPALSKRAISAEIDRTPIRVSRSWARRGTRPNGARSRTRPKRHGRKLTPSTWCWRSARSPSSACNAPSSKAG